MKLAIYVGLLFLITGVSACKTPGNLLPSGVYREIGSKNEIIIRNGDFTPSMEIHRANRVYKIQRTYPYTLQADGSIHLREVTSSDFAFGLGGLKFAWIDGNILAYDPLNRTTNVFIWPDRNKASK